MLAARLAPQNAECLEKLADTARYGAEKVKKRSEDKFGNAAHENAAARVTPVNVVEMGIRSEVATDHAALVES